MSNEISTCIFYVWKQTSGLCVKLLICLDNSAQVAVSQILCIQLDKSIKARLTIHF